MHASITMSQWEEYRQNAMMIVEYANDPNFDCPAKYSGHPVPSLEEVMRMDLDDYQNFKNYVAYIVLYIEKDDDGKYIFEPNPNEKEKLDEIRPYLSKFIRDHVDIIFDDDEDEEEEYLEEVKNYFEGK